MTVKEALKSTVNFPLPEAAMDKTIIDADLDGSAQYTKEDSKAVDKCMLGLLFNLLTSADIMEDDLSVKLPERSVLLKVYSAICNKWGFVDLLADAKPTVKRVSLW